MSLGGVSLVVPVLVALRMLIEGEILCDLDGGFGRRCSVGSVKPSFDGFLLIRPDLVICEPVSEISCEDAVMSWGCALPIWPVHS